MIILFLTALIANCNAGYDNAAVISVYGDVHKDVEFFTTTYPWIIDNIGGEIIVSYHLLGSGRYSVPQMCALQDLQYNSFLQAQYLRCEAKGKPSEYCLCEAGIDPKKFKECVASGGSLVGFASAKFSKLGINFSPIIELKPNGTVYGVDGISFLEKICTIFGDNLPRGCVQYSNQTESLLEKKALAQFDRTCHKEFPISEDDMPVTPTSEATITPEEPDWSTTSPWATQTTPTPWATTEGPTVTTEGTMLPWWSTTSPPWTTLPPWWSSTSPPPSEGSTAKEGSTTSLPDWQTTSTPEWWSTTPPPWWFTTSTHWWSTTSPPSWSTTPWVTKTTPYPKTSTTSEGSTSSSPDWLTTSTPGWWATTSTKRPTWWPTQPWPTRTVPPLPTTTSQPTKPTFWPTWLPTRTTPSNPWMESEETTTEPN